MCLSACLKKERGCVGDQPQHVASSSTHRKFKTCCGWSRTTQPRSGFFRQVLRLKWLVFVPVLLTGVVPLQAFEGRITASLTRGGMTQTFGYTYGTNTLRLETVGSSSPDPINLINRTNGALTILFPANRSFIRLKASDSAATAPMFPPQMPAVPGSSMPGRPTAIGPTNLPGTPAMPRMPQMPGKPQLPRMPQMPPSGMGGGMPTMPMMPMPGDKLELKSTGEKTNLLGFACEKFELRQRDETMEIWATQQLPAFSQWQANQHPPFGPQMIEDKWGDLLHAKKVFPLLAVLKFKNGPERLRFEVKSITPQKPEKQNPTLFHPPANYHELQPLPF